MLIFFSFLKLDLVVDDIDIKFLIWKILFDFDKIGWKYVYIYIIISLINLRYVCYKFIKYKFYIFKKE